MPRFFFNLLDHAGVDYLEGRELPDVAAAREQAQRFALDMAATSLPGHVNPNTHRSIQVAGDGGVLFEVKFGASVAMGQ